MRQHWEFMWIKEPHIKKKIKFWSIQMLISIFLNSWKEMNNEPARASFELADKNMTLHPNDTLLDIKIMKNKNEHYCYF